MRSQTEDGYGNKVELVFGNNLGDIKKKGGGRELKAKSDGDKSMSNNFQVSIQEYGHLHFAFEMIQHYKTNIYFR